MNITVIRLVIVATSIGLVVMCKILTVVVAFFWMHALILLSLAVTHYRSSWCSYLQNSLYIMDTSVFKTVVCHRPLLTQFSIWLKKFILGEIYHTISIGESLTVCNNVANVPQSNKRSPKSEYKFWDKLVPLKDSFLHDGCTPCRHVPRLLSTCNYSICILIT